MRWRLTKTGSGIVEFGSIDVLDLVYVPPRTIDALAPIDTDLAHVRAFYLQMSSGVQLTEFRQPQRWYLHGHHLGVLLQWSFEHDAMLAYHLAADDTCFC